MADNRFQLRLEAHDLHNYIEFAEIIPNGTIKPDSAGRPPMSWEFRVRYSEHAPADIDDRVAWAIANTVLAGWIAFGRTWTKTVDIGYGETVNVGLTVLD